jgi:hypothetical protein
MNIACCGIDREQFHAVEQACGCPVLYFADAPDRRGDVRLAYALRDGVPIRLAVVGYQGAAGLTACDFLCSHLPGERILWLCRRPEFSTEARRLGVHFYPVGPPDTVPPDQITQELIRLLRQQPEYNKGGITE